jgi:hypothetical protein
MHNSKYINTEESVLYDNPKGTLTRVAEIVKSAYRRRKAKAVQEELYDHEKDNKDPATVKRKDPKFDKFKGDEKDKDGKKPTAAAILHGGRTMTGQDRDIVEIDPNMRGRPGQPDITKKDDKDKSKNKKEK